MKFKLRKYQEEAVAACFNYLENCEGNPIICMPTGSGKSIVIAEICKRILRHAGTRILVVTHVKELIEQNHAKMPHDINAGIYSAGVGIRNTHNRVIFCGIQSIYKKAEIFGEVDLVIIDECHLLSPNQDTMYGKFIEDLQPKKVCGLTATPFRTKDGLLTDTTLFDDICYNLSIDRLIKEGYLSPLKSKGGIVHADMTGVDVVAGEYNRKQMAERFDQDDITKVAVEEIKEMGKNRRSWLIFCSSIKHAFHVQEYIYGSRVVTGKTPKDERKEILDGFRDGKIRCVINYGVLTTGFDAPIIDMIVLLRATKSTSLYVQMLGRGMRVAPNKENCLVLDYGENIIRHGPVDAVTIRKKIDSDGKSRDVINVQPTQICPQCRSDNHAKAASCFFCGYEFPLKVNIEKEASEEPVLSIDVPIEEMTVASIVCSEHIAKKTGIPLLKVEYQSDHLVPTKLYDWVCLEHEGWARTKARTWWLDRAGTSPPDSIQEAIERLDELNFHDIIEYKKIGKYPEIVGYRNEKKTVNVSDRSTEDSTEDDCFEIMF